MYSAKLRSSKVVYAMYKVVLAFEYIERTSKMLSNEFFESSFVGDVSIFPLRLRTTRLLLSFAIYVKTNDMSRF